MRLCAAAEGHLSLSLKRGRTAAIRNVWTSRRQNSSGLPSPALPGVASSWSSKRVIDACSGQVSCAVSAAGFAALPCSAPVALLPSYPSLSVNLRESSLSAPSSRAVLLSALPVVMAGAVQPADKVEVMVKAASGNPEKIGDCPFSQRVMLTLEEAHIPYERLLVDTSNKPKWFLEANPDGKVPVLKHEGGWLPDSDAIVKALEEKFPSAKKLHNTEEESAVASGLFGAFVKFLKGTGPEEGLLAQLHELESALAKSGGPFVAGKEYSAVDARLVPALYHIQIALQHFKSWKIPDSFTHVLQYIKDVESRESFKNTAATPEAVIAGWTAHGV